jgi:hypothetical protein
LDHLPQIVGVRCTSCNKLISSITEGSYCSLCYNPVHNQCKPRTGTVDRAGHCSECGADPQSAAATAARAEARNQFTKSIAAVCPDCGNRHGLKPLLPEQKRDEESPVFARVSLGMLAAGLFDIVSSASRLAEGCSYECLKCGCVFRPKNGPGALVYVAVAVFAAAVIAVVTYAFLSAGNPVPRR